MLNPARLQCSLQVRVDCIRHGASGRLTMINRAVDQALTGMDSLRDNLSCSQLLFLAPCGIIRLRGKSKCLHRCKCNNFVRFRQ